jgi:hypothetical protein
MTKLRWNNPPRERNHGSSLGLQKKMKEWAKKKPKDVPRIKMDERLMFGKYRGFTPRQLKDKDPEYLLNCQRNRTFYVID